MLNRIARWPSSKVCPMLRNSSTSYPVACRIFVKPHRSKKYRCSRIRRKSSRRLPNNRETNEDESIVDTTRTPPGTSTSRASARNSNGSVRCSIVSKDVMTAIDEALDVLINRTGLVGR